MNLIIVQSAEGDFAMINIKPPEEETDEIIRSKEELWKKLNPDAYYLKEISNTLKDILKEMRKRKV